LKKAVQFCAAFLRHFDEKYEIFLQIIDQQYDLLYNVIE